MKPAQIVLLTGGSSGIGAATALMLAQAGMTVYATSRSGKAPEHNRIIPLVMDVNDAEAVAHTVSWILAEQGRLDAVVCNAGNGMAGAAEDTSIDEVRYQFETCFYGAVKVIDACLPVFRRQGYGRVLTVTSVAAFIPIPYQAFYSSVKAALLMYTKALSLEVAPFGIQCCSILPGDTKTGFTSARKYAEKAREGAYAERMARSVAKMEKDEQNGMSPDVIARAICKQLTRSRMQLHVTPRLDYKAIEVLSRVLPERLVMWIVSLLYC